MCNKLPSHPRVPEKARNDRWMQMMDGLDDSSSARARASEDGPQRPVDEDADIFGDAGRDYQPELPQSTNGVPNSFPHARHHYLYVMFEL